MFISHKLSPYAIPERLTLDLRYCYSTAFPLNLYSCTPLLFNLHNLFYQYFLGITILFLKFIFLLDLHNTYRSIFCKCSISQLKVPQDMEQSKCRIYDIFTILIPICSKIPFSPQFFYLYIKILHNKILYILFLLYILILKRNTGTML